MKKYLFGAVAALTVAAPAAAFADMNQSYVGANYSTVDSDATADEVDAWGVDGAFSFGGDNSLGVELDASYADYDEDASDRALGMAAHLFYRNDSYLIGGFVSRIDVADSEVLAAGVETEWYFNSFTLAGAVTTASDDDADADGYGADVQGRFFLSDNFRLQGQVGWASIDAAGGDDDVISYGLGAEYKFGTSPISVLAGWSHAETDETDVEADALSVGIRWNFGGGTLKDRDRNGASLAGLSGVGTALGL